MNGRCGFFARISDWMLGYRQYGGDVGTDIASQIHDLDPNALRPEAIPALEAPAEVVHTIVTKHEMHARMNAAAVAHLLGTFSYARCIPAFIHSVSVLIARIRARGEDSVKPGGVRR